MVREQHHKRYYMGECQKHFHLWIFRRTKQIRYRMEVEQFIRGDGEKLRNFLHRIKGTVDEGWPDDMNANEVAHQNAERGAQA